MWWDVNKIVLLQIVLLQFISDYYGLIDVFHFTNWIYIKVMTIDFIYLLIYLIFNRMFNTDRLRFYGGNINLTSYLAC